MTNLLRNLRIQDAATLLREIASSNEKKTDMVDGPITDVMVGPHVYTGIPVKVQHAAGEPWLALYKTKAGERGLEALCVLPLKLVTGVTVHEVRKHISFVTTAGAFTVADGEAPSRLAIERFKTSLIPLFESMAGSGKPIDLDWNGGEDDAKPRLFMHTLLKQFEDCLKTFKDDAMAVESLAGLALVGFRFDPEASLESNREGGKIIFSFGNKMDLNNINVTFRQLFEQQL